MKENNIMKVDTADGPRLGFATGISPRRFRGADMVELKQSNGFIVHPGGQIENWEIENMIEIENQMIVIGPWHADIKPIESSEITFDLISLLSIAARTLATMGFPLGGYFRQAFHQLSDGSVFVMPPKLAAWTRGSMSLQRLAQEWERWTHPDLRGEEAWSFALAVLCWMSLSGKDPFNEEENEQRRERIRTGSISPLTLKAAAVNDFASAFICRALSPGDQSRPKLSEWDNFIRQWKNEGITKELSEAELQHLRETDEQKRKHIEGRLKKRRWIRQSGWKFLIVSASIIITISFLWTPVKKALELPVTVGMDSYQVAETYYNAFNELDSAVMNDCLARRVGRNDVQMVDTVFVTQKVRQGYERIQQFPTAAEWLAAGRPDLPQGLWPWGITDLILTPLPGGSIEAHYRFWTMAEDLTPEDPRYSGTWHRDVLRFREGRHSWEISAIERTIED